MNTDYRRFADIRKFLRPGSAFEQSPVHASKCPNIQELILIFTIRSITTWGSTTIRKTPFTGATVYQYNHLAQLGSHG